MTKVDMRISCNDFFPGVLADATPEDTECFNKFLADMIAANTRIDKVDWHFVGNNRIVIDNIDLLCDVNAFNHNPTTSYVGLGGTKRTFPVYITADGDCYNFRLLSVGSFKGVVYQGCAKDDKTGEWGIACEVWSQGDSSDLTRIFIRLGSKDKCCMPITYGSHIRFNNLVKRLDGVSGPCWYADGVAGVGGRSDGAVQYFRIC